MATGVNKFIGIGNLGKDVEVRYTQGGTAVGNFSLAINERQKKGEEWVDHTEWVSIVVFGKMAENCQQYLKKGSTAYVEGRIQTRKWQDKEGKDRYTTEIVAQTVQFLGGKGTGAESSTGAENGGSSGSPETGASYGGGAGYDPNDDIPFAPYTGF